MKALDEFDLYVRLGKLNLKLLKKVSNPKIMTYASGSLRLLVGLWLDLCTCSGWCRTSETNLALVCAGWHCCC